MAGPNPAGFVPAEVIAGLHTAMSFGLPSRAEDRPAFYMPREVILSGAADDESVPFDPAERPTLGPEVVQRVQCAIELDDDRGEITNLGVKTETRVTITLLDPDYQKVRGFEYVLIGGEKYKYVQTVGPVALGTVDVWTVFCEAEDDQ